MGGAAVTDAVTRRHFLARAGAVAAGAVLTRTDVAGLMDGRAAYGASRVVIARDEALTSGKVDEHRELLCKLLDASMQRLTEAPDATAAWRKVFKPKQRVGIKVNTLGFTIQPAVVDAIVAGLRKAGVPAEKIIIWNFFMVSGFILCRRDRLQNKNFR